MSCIVLLLPFFFQLLDEITEEVERDMANGNFGTGSGFDGRSSGRLGGRGPVPVHNPNPVQLRQKILQAAEGRLKKQKIMSSGPQRLGMSPPSLLIFVFVYRERQ